MIETRMTSLTYYSLMPEWHGDISPGLYSKLVIQFERYQELRVSANVLLCGFEKEVWLESRDLAEAYRSALVPVFERRYGADVFRLSVIECSVRTTKEDDRKRMERDSKIVRARLAQNVMAPNKRPSLSDEED